MYASSERVSQGAARAWYFGPERPRVSALPQARTTRADEAATRTEATTPTIGANKIAGTAPLGVTVVDDEEDDAPLAS